jgi:hypothetical protein
MTGYIQHIIMIESLVDERLTGSELYNDCIRRQIELQKSTLTHCLYKVDTKEEFKQLLEHIISTVSHLQNGLLLHLEMHGADNLKGLILANGEFISWRELVDFFRAINVGCCNHLYLSLATCNGRFLWQGVDPDLKSPYSCYISASASVRPDEIVEEYFRLFENLIRQGNLIEAYLAMEDAGTHFYYKDSETTFEEAYKVSKETALEDPGFKKELLKKAEDEMNKQGCEMPQDEGFYESVVKKALLDTYNRHKKAFDCTDCK